jgi:Flp pilus assembly protein TadD
MDNLAYMLDRRGERFEAESLYRRSIALCYVEAQTASPSSWRGRAQPVTR